MTGGPAGRRRLRATKIVATLGPGTSTPARIRALFDAGVDMFRLNFSHGRQAEHGERLAMIREVERAVGRPIAVLADLQGPKLRIGAFAAGAIALAPGMALRLDLDPAPGDARRVALPHPEIFAALAPDAALLLNDGRVRLRVERCGADFADTVVESGTELSDRKGVNVPGVVLPLSPLTAKDRDDLRYALEIGVDWVALSFVQRPEDVAEARRLIGGRAALMAKIEKPAAIDCLEEIVGLADAVMVARGDLGVEMPAEDVPPIQKRIVREARRAGRPVVVATQMLESMISSPAPTRAEASDVATAVYDGADGIMLSAETATGAYPVEAVAMMDRICRRVEHDPAYRAVMEADRPAPRRATGDAITAAARQVAQTLGAAAIVTYTTSGSTTLRAARERPEVPVLCLTAELATARRLAVSYGVHAVAAGDVADYGDMVRKASRIARRDGFAVAGQSLVITAGVPFGTPGNTNALRVAAVEEEPAPAAAPAAPERMAV
ncbi:MAG TPA: pyruvate kinase [Alphaproteobacteria bacterium]|nr:pyruvate kinase [Alphaproteobacteria bacterium]